MVYKTWLKAEVISIRVWRYSKPLCWDLWAPSKDILLCSMSAVHNVWDISISKLRHRLPRSTRSSAGSLVSICRCLCGFLNHVLIGGHLICAVYCLVKGSLGKQSCSRIYSMPDIPAPWRSLHVSEHMPSGTTAHFVLSFVNSLLYFRGSGAAAHFVLSFAKQSAQKVQ